MQHDVLLPRKSSLTIYAFSLAVSSKKGQLKVGYTTKGAKTRVGKQLSTLNLGPDAEIVLEESARRNDGSYITDHEVHKYLMKKGFRRRGREWFECTIQDVKAAIIAVRDGIENDNSRTENFKMRPEQEEAVEKTIAYFRSFKEENANSIPHFLWNAKMRFGKTFASYQLAKSMGWNKILVLTFKPAVQSAWQKDLESHIDFKGWQFIAKNGLQFSQADLNKPFVCFGSFQDYLGKNSAGGIKPKNEWVHTVNWDCVILDEYHYGAWRENAKELFEAESKKEQQYSEGEGIEYFDESNMPIKTGAYLYLSGTPFRAIASGEFIEEQIFNWTYSDEQKAKESWNGDNNPYDPLPGMVMYTYQLPDTIREIAMGKEFNQFDLNVFFSAVGEKAGARFKYEDEVQKWLDLIRGALLETTIDNLKLGSQKPRLPFSDAKLLNELAHTFWFLPSVSACHAMKNLLEKKQNIFYQGYTIIVAAGDEAGMGVNALPPIYNAMEMDADPRKTKTITLSCGKLTTGVSVPPWTGIFMLRNCANPETYFQAAFRVQTPWAIRNSDGMSPNKKEIIKHKCYIFDFAPDRALRHIVDYSCRLNIKESNPEEKVREFIQFLPVLAYDGSSMKHIDAAGVLDIAMSGTTATLLARRWESALLVNVDNSTLKRLMDNKDAMNALMKIEGFRGLRQEIEIIINRSESIKEAKKEANHRVLSAKEKRKLTDEEKEYQNARKRIQEKLIKFSTRIPVFMYLTDYRERSLKDIITQLEPGLFKRVTGLDVKDFELLVSLGVFNSSLMNDAVYKFKRYEDPSLQYTGINHHQHEKNVGLYDTEINAEEYNRDYR